LTGTRHIFIDAPGVGTHALTPEADISSAIVSVGKGPQENLDRESEIRTWGDAGNGGGAELLASQAPQGEDVVSPDTEEDEEEPQEEDDGCAISPGHLRLSDQGALSHSSLTRVRAAPLSPVVGQSDCALRGEGGGERGPPSPCLRG
jgi:hypothetical protein